MITKPTNKSGRPPAHHENAKTTGERVAALRQRRADLGLTRLELYAHPTDHQAIKEYAAKLAKQRERKRA